MFWSELGAAFLAAILSGIFFKIIEDLNNQRRLVALLIALENECKYNSKYSGNHLNPFQVYWLEKALSSLDFYEQCGLIALKSLELFELMKESTNGLTYRELVPADIQEKSLKISNEINKVLPEIRKRSFIFEYLLWHWRSIFIKNH